MKIDNDVCFVVGRLVADKSLRDLFQSEPKRVFSKIGVLPQIDKLEMVSDILNRFENSASDDRTTILPKFRRLDRFVQG